MHDIPIVIFAGGKSSRMGRDKALLSFGEYNSLAEYQYKRLSKEFNDIYISAKNDKFDFKVDIIYDYTTDISSPLIGIISVLEFFQNRDVFILGVDIPFISLDDIKTIIQYHIQYNSDTTIAKSPNGIEPLCGVYTPKVLPKAKENLKNNQHSLTKLLQSLNTKYIPFTQKNSFSNLNFMDDYTKATQFYGKMYRMDSNNKKEKLWKKQNHL